MTETTPARKRRPLVIAAGVLVLAVLALAAWVLTRPSSPAGERDRALRGVLEQGGPEGWTPARDPAVPGSWTEQDGRPVLLGDDGFTVVWSTSPATAQSCAALAAWATGRIAGAAGSDVAASCPAALRDAAGGANPFSSYRTEAGEHGRYLFSARLGGDTLYAGLTYEGPNALR
ncbi:hypothetical protein [Actinoplanes siamensis]|uniref:Uncharacterized protein n=1 Tax=Actinoplanes siamensis TaxID=1223317 RepID=A0A919N8Y3_9ACTN|nr:hypothetical protein [Actinoplanes siamensis]GIF06688.1 hypothetical protein Asi03nite_42260 [Actinoplanes siamensis]